jgi:hypothetical protein
VDYLLSSSCDVKSKVEPTRIERKRLLFICRCWVICHQCSAHPETFFSRLCVSQLSAVRAIFGSLASLFQPTRLAVPAWIRGDRPTSCSWSVQQVPQEPRRPASSSWAYSYGSIYTVLGKLVFWFKLGGERQGHPAGGWGQYPKRAIARRNDTRMFGGTRWNPCQDLRVHRERQASLQCRDIRPNRSISESKSLRASRRSVRSRQETSRSNLQGKSAQKETS